MDHGGRACGVVELQPDAADAAGADGASGAVVGRTGDERAEALWGRETMAGMAHGSFANGNRLDTPAGRGARTYALRRNGETQTLVEGRRDMHFKHHLSIKGTEVPPR